MATLIVSPQAEADLVAIGDWIAQNSPDRAVTFIAGLRQVFVEIARLPRAYAAVPRLGRHARRRNHGRYAIFYNVTGGTVTILTVVHGARDIRRLF